MSLAVAEPPSPPATAVVGTRGGRYLSFALGREEFGLQILKVREIIGIMDITVVPHAPEYVRGVINLRGQIIAVIDLRARFHMPPATAGMQTCIIVTEVQVPLPDGSPGRRVLSGIVVDRVCEVLSIPEGDIDDAPELFESVDSQFILGMGKVASAVKILLDIDRVVNPANQSVIAAE